MIRLMETSPLLNLTLMKLKRPSQQIPTLNYLQRNILSLSSRRIII
nr:MAG TPA: hypothetical protein [Caudoviricetes sp.]